MSTTMGQSEVLAGTCQGKSSHDNFFDKGERHRSQYKQLLSERSVLALLFVSCIGIDGFFVLNSIFDFFSSILVEGIFCLTFLTYSPQSVKRNTSTPVTIINTHAQPLHSIRRSDGQLSMNECTMEGVGCLVLFINL